MDRIVKRQRVICRERGSMDGRKCSQKKNRHYKEKYLAEPVHKRVCLDERITDDTDWDKEQPEYKKVIGFVRIMNGNVRSIGVRDVPLYIFPDLHLRDGNMPSDQDHQGSIAARQNARDSHGGTDSLHHILRLS